MNMSAQAGWPVTLGGVPLTIIQDPDSPEKKQAPGYSGSYQTQDSTLTIAKRNVPVYYKRFSGGFGVVRRKDSGDDGRYGWLENGIGWLDNGLQPAGRQQIISPTSSNNSYIIGSVLFDGHLWLLSTLDGLIKIPNADPAQTPVVHPTSAAFNGSTSGFRSGYAATAICVFAKADATPAIYVGTRNPSTGDSRLYQYTVAGGWAESNVLGFQVAILASVWWEDEGAIGAERLAAKVADSGIRHCISGTDPLDPASWITPVTVGNAGYEITAFVAAPQHLYPIKRNGIHDFNAIRAMNLTPYWTEQPQFNGLTSATLYNDYVVAVRGYGLDRYYVGDPGRLQSTSNECGPSYGTQDGHPIQGYPTALAQHSGYMLCNIYNPDNLTQYLMRARPRGSDEPGINPYVWHGAEQVIAPTGSAANEVTHVCVATPTASSGPPAAARQTYVWMCAIRGSSPSTTIRLYYAPLPTGSGPLSVQASGGTFTAAATARYFIPGHNWDDGNAQKFVRIVDIAGSRVTAARPLDVLSRADGDPSSMPDQSTWKAEGTATSDQTTITPATETKGRSIAWQVVATTPSPYTTWPIFNELSPSGKLVRRSFKVLYLNVLLEKDHGIPTMAADIRDADTTFDSITALQDQGLVVFVDTEGTSHNGYVEQSITFGRVMTTLTGGWRTVARVELSLAS